MDQPSRDQEWFIAADDTQHGPVSAAQAWYLLVDGQLAPPVHVWHPTLPEWRTLAPGAPEPPPAAVPPAAATVPPLQLDGFRLSNARTVTWLACVSAPVFVVGAALARDAQDATFTLLLVAVVAFLAWWLFLEQKGVQLANGELSYPARAPFRPYPPLWLRRFRLADASGFECWSQGPASQWFLVHANASPHRILLDEALHREVLTLALERNIPPGARPASEER